MPHAMIDTIRVALWDMPLDLSFVYLRPSLRYELLDYEGDYGRCLSKSSF